jgi:hypothetical protein
VSNSAINTPSRPLRVFINYRRDDAWGQAQLLYDRLANRLGSENVFLDVRNLQPGMKWLDAIKSHRDSCDVLLALIGSHWASILKQRDHAAVVNPAEDYVRFEIQDALQPDSGIRVIPVLVGDNVPFVPEDLPRSLQPLARTQVARLRPERFEEDISALIARLEALAREDEVPASPMPERRSEPQTPVPTGASGTAAAAAPPPDAAHFEEVLRQMVDEGNVAVFLGSRLPSASAGPGVPSAPLLGNDALAASLAERFGMKAEGLDLPAVAQHVYATRGRSDLYTTLRQLLKVSSTPGPVHSFLARFPRMIRQLGLPKRYQLIVSANFDTSLEQAFDEEQEPYDLAVYMASGPDSGRFVHFPFEGAPEPIREPNSYTRLPIGLEYELERTVIVKIHGVVDSSVGTYRIKDDYVITEDHYIDYLSRSPIESLVPIQVLDKLRESHCLFLGYPVRDWNLRVFMKRIWDGSPGATSWAVEPHPDTLEKRLWAQSEVELYGADLGDYVDRIQQHLTARTAVAAQP